MEASVLAERLLEQIRARCRHPVSDAVAAAYRTCPRHEFVPRYVGADGVWRDPSSAGFLEACYEDTALQLAEPVGGLPVSSISQPQLVLDMLTSLAVRPGDRVLEIGAGSGWNAAMLGQLVGPTGSVTSVEILPEIAASAARAVARWPWVSVVAGDASRGWLQGPYDRIMYTASAPDLPDALYTQVPTGGRLALVLHVMPDFDALMFLDRTRSGFTSSEVRQCRFVPIVGDGQARTEDHDRAELLRTLGTARPPVVRAFWLGAEDRREFPWRSLPFRLFLALSEASYRPIGRDGAVFALADRGSVVVCSHGRLERYGGPSAERRLWRALDRWVRLGMPATNGWTVTATRRTRRAQYAVVRRQSTFVWQPLTP